MFAVPLEEARVGDYVKFKGSDAALASTAIDAAVSKGDDLSLAPAMFGFVQIKNGVMRGGRPGTKSHWRLRSIADGKRVTYYLIGALRAAGITFVYRRGAG